VFHFSKHSKLKRYEKDIKNTLKDIKKKTKKDITKKQKKPPTTSPAGNNYGWGG
jgi:hypothetical protein